MGCASRAPSRRAYFCTWLSRGLCGVCSPREEKKFSHRHAIFFVELARKHADLRREKKTARVSSSRCALAAEFFRTAPRDYPTTRVYDFFLRLRADVRVASPAALP